MRRTTIAATPEVAHGTIAAGKPVRFYKPVLRCIDNDGNQRTDVLSWKPTQTPPLRRRAENRRRNRIAATSRKANRP